MGNGSAMRVRLLIEKPSANMTANVIKIDNGNATTGMSVSVARPRKAYITITTRMNEMNSVHFTSATELTMLCERSNAGTRVIDPGKLALNSGKSALTEFATSTAFAPAARCTASTTTDPGGLNPRTQNVRDILSSCTLWRTSATSFRKPGELSLFRATIKLR